MKITGGAVVAMYTVATTNAGFLLGCTFFGDYFVGVKWTDVLAAFGAVMGGFATAFAAYLAYMALNSWKDQFAHSQRYESIVTLEKAYYKLIEDFYDYSQSTLWSNRIKSGTIAHSDLQKLADNFELHKRNWQRSLNMSISSLEWACTFCTDEEVRSIDNIVEVTELLMCEQIKHIECSQRTNNQTILVSIELEDSLKTASKNVKEKLVIIRKST
ncbi:hypothetical protein V6255_12295 [Psychromonas arctica]|uniref:Uncharacterized protein n=1 Tax=Psychromonas arctica TaxID=168275 RepID=A0ABU9HDZ1_9GAMM